MDMEKILKYSYLILREQNQKSGAGLIKNHLDWLDIINIINPKDFTDKVWTKAELCI